MTPEQIKSSEALASVESKDFRKTRGFSGTAGIRRDLLTDSITGALSLFAEQIEESRLKEETRILSSEEFVAKMDELIQATINSKATITDEQIAKAAANGSK